MSDPGHGVGSADADSIQGLVRYAQWLRERPPDTLAPVRDTAEQSVRTSGTDTDRIRLALVLSVPDTAFRDEARARALLADTLSDVADNDTALRAFVTMLAVNLDDMARVRDDMRHRLAAERERREEVEQKLEELKDIERQLHRRDQFDSGAVQ